MGYLPMNTTFRITQMHLRGIRRCLSLGIYDLQAMADKCLVPDVELLEAALTDEQKAVIAEATKPKKKPVRKKAAKKKEPE